MLAPDETLVGVTIVTMILPQALSVSWAGGCKNADSQGLIAMEHGSAVEMQ
jgi:hypothetical protein